MKCTINLKMSIVFHVYILKNSNTKCFLQHRVCISLQSPPVIVHILYPNICWHLCGSAALVVTLFDRYWRNALLGVSNETEPHPI